MKLPQSFYLLFLSSFCIPLLGQIRQEDDRPNMIVINVDELRWDGLSITGHPFVKTPHIDRIAKEGMLMENSFCHSLPKQSGPRLEPEVNSNVQALDRTVPSGEWAKGG